MDKFNELYEKVTSDEVIEESKRLDDKQANKIVKILDKFGGWTALYLLDSEADADKFYDITGDKLATALFITTIPLGPGQYMDAKEVERIMKENDVE